MSFRTRIALTAAGAVAIAVAVVSIAAWLASARSLRSEVDRDLEEAASELVTIPQGFLLGVINLEENLFFNEELFIEIRGRSRRNLFGPLPAGRFGGASGFAQVVDVEGNLISLGGDLRIPADYEYLPIGERVQAMAAGVETETFFETAEVSGETVRILTRQLMPGLALQVARPLDEVEASLRKLAVTLGVGSVAGVALAAVLGLVVAQLAIRPVAALTASAEHVAETRDLSHRIELQSSDELGRLGGSFNTMLEALESSEAARRQLVADASHELRTPLTSLKTNVEVLAGAGPLTESDRQALIGDVVEQLDELNLLVTDLIDAAREEEPIDLLVPLALDGLVIEAVERAERNHPRIEFQVTSTPCQMRGVPRRLSRAVGNLLDNAAKWSGDGNPVEVTVAACVVTVRDHGPGIGEADLPHVFDRFYRAVDARAMPGSGLGLAIVAQVAATHGGTVSARNHPDGGAEFSLSFSAGS
jgi:two-component system sensor histidine kinase MprB